MSEQAHPIPAGWLNMYHDGELDPARREQLESHLVSCESCRRELAALRSLSDALAADRLADDALTRRSEFWHKLEPRLRARESAAPSPLRWLPGIGLLLANGLVQFLAVVGVVTMFLAGHIPWMAQSVDWLNSAIVSWLLGWPAWLVPTRWSGWGMTAFFALASAWLAVLYMAWLGYLWRYRWQPVVRPIE